MSKQIPPRAGWMPALAVSAIGFGLWVGCSVNPATGNRQLNLLSESQEIAMGREADQGIVAQYGLVEDEGLQRYVADLGAALAAESERPDLPWTFRVVDDPVVNAFALPGGFIYVTRGILAHLNSEAELAGVLGHEIGHVTARHGANQMSKAMLAQGALGVATVLAPDAQNWTGLASQGLGLLFLKYGRDDETQADELGLRYMVRDGWQGSEIVDVFRTLGRVSAASGSDRLPNWLSTHPQPADRERHLTRLLGPGGEGRVNRQQHLSEIDGVVFGANPREGFVIDSTFYHPDLRFQLAFPSGWQSVNQRQAFVAVHPDRRGVIQLTLGRGSNVAEAAQQFFGQSGIEAGSAWRQSINGLRARSGYFAVANNGQEIRGLAAFVEHRDQIYQVLAYAGASSYGALDRDFQASLASFAPLRDNRLLGVEPLRLEIETLSRSATPAELAQRWNSPVDAETLALLNQADVDEALPSGSPVKRVVGERPGR